SVGAELCDLSYRAARRAGRGGFEPPTSRASPGALPRTAPVRPAAGWQDCCSRGAGPELLSQLSHRSAIELRAGLEPATCRFVVDNRNHPARSSSVVAVVACDRVRIRTAGLRRSPEIT